MVVEATDISEYDITPRSEDAGLRPTQSRNAVYRSPGESPDVVKQVHPGTAVWHSVTMAAGESNQTAPLTASIDDVVARLESVAGAIEEYLRGDAPAGLREEVREWNRDRGSEDPVAVVARHVAVKLVLRTALYEWYTQRGRLPLLRDASQDVFETAADVTGNTAFETGESVLGDVVQQLPSDVVAELTWWRHGVVTAEDPADDIGYLFEEVIPAEDRQRHGQFRTPQRVSRLLRELAVQDGDRVLDPGMGAGALSVPRASRSASVYAYGVERTRIGFLMATTALALSGQPADVYEADFFDVGPATLGMNPDARIPAGDRSASRGVDIVPGEVDAVVGNPPYVANRNLEREATHYRRHLRAFGPPDRTPYVDGAKKLSGRSNLFVYFLTYATQFLADGGRLVYLLPTKWMETQYGETLQTFLFDHYKVSAVIAFDDAVFDDAQVDAVLLVADRCADAAARRGTETRFITVTGEVSPETINDLVTGDRGDPDTDNGRDGQTCRDTPGCRVVTVRQSELEARGAGDGPLAQCLRAPSALQSLQSNEMLVSLDALAAVSYGQRTGKNEFFLLDDADLDAWPIADRFCRPAIDDLGDEAGYRLTASDSDITMLNVHEYIASLDEDDEMVRSQAPLPETVIAALARDGYETLRAYIEEWADEHDEDLLRADRAWFDMGPLDAPDVVHPYRIHSDGRVFANQAALVPTNCGNGIDVEPGVDTEALLGYLNSTVHAAFLEVWGQREGGGSLEVPTRTLRRIPVADVRAFSHADREAVVSAYRALVRGDPGAQAQLDEAVLAALDADIDAATLHDLQQSLVHDRVPDT